MKQGKMKFMTKSMHRTLFWPFNENALKKKVYSFIFLCYNSLTSNTQLHLFCVGECCHAGLHILKKKRQHVFKWY